MLNLPPLGTVLRQSPGEPPVDPTNPGVASLPVQRRLAPGEVADLVAAYRQGVLVEDLATSFRVNRTTVLGHVRRQGVPRRDRRALQGDDVDRAAQLYAGGGSADWVAAQLGVAASTVRRTLKEVGVPMRPGGRQRRSAGVATLATTPRDPVGPVAGPQPRGQVNQEPGAGDDMSPAPGSWSPTVRQGRLRVSFGAPG